VGFEEGSRSLRTSTSPPLIHRGHVLRAPVDAWNPGYY